jgi:hypothetical protein
MVGKALIPRLSCAGGVLLFPKDARLPVRIGFAWGAVHVTPPSVDFLTTRESPDPTPPVWL